MRARRARRHVAAAVVGIGLGVVAAGSPASAAERALELVSPAGGDGDVRFGGGEAAPGGDIVCFNSDRVLVQAPTNGLVTADDGYCSRRTSSGWRTEWVTGPAVRDPRGLNGAQIYFVSADGSRVAFASDMGLFPDFPGGGPGEVSGTRSAFMWEAGRTRWLAPTPIPERDLRDFGPGVGTEREPLAASADLSHGIFISRLGLVAEDTNGELDTYEWTPDGIRVVSRDGSGRAVGGWPGLGTSPNQLMAVPGAISRDGSRIFFEHRDELKGSPAAVVSVFLREGDELTHISPRSGPGPAADVSFVGATSDGATAFLTSAEQLTSETKRAGIALYRYDVARTELSLVATAADDTDVVFLGASADGSTLVYRSGGFVPQLFVRQDGVERALGALDFRDTIAEFDSSAGDRSDKRAMRISSDGETLVFTSFAAFDGSPGNTRQVYRWTAADGVRWISKDAAATAPTANAALGNFGAAIPLPGEWRLATLNAYRGRPNLGRVMSDDGSRIFFETPERLVPRDINSVVDVYEWRDGALSLVSPGTQTEDALYHDSSADGRTVFFTTMSRLIPQLDRTNDADLYAAREGGGFELETETVCEDDGCQGASPRPPAVPLPGSATLRAPGNTVESPPPVARHRATKLGRRERRALVRRGRTVLRIRASRPGVLVLTATARFGRRSVVVARATQAAREASTTRMPLKLSRRARTTLRARGRLRLVIRIAYSESDTMTRQVVVLRG